tara:strand:+ start:549 stop:752 length:204 start_codon:yes stop_codon:yes gene_type:complete
MLLTDQGLLSTKKLLESAHPRGYTQIKQHILTLTLHEIPPSLTPQNKPQTAPISPLRETLTSTVNLL